MEFEQYRFFVSTAEEKSVIKAADKLYVTRQTISAALNRMEDEAGFPLFKRSNQGMELTEEGLVYYKKAKKLLKDFERLNADIKGYGRRKKGILRVGIVPHLEYRQAVLFDRWCEARDDFGVEKYFVSGDRSNAMLEGDELDCVLTMMPNMGSSFFVSAEITTLPLYLYVHKDNPLAGKSEVCEEDLVGQLVAGELSGYSEMEYEGEHWMYYKPKKIRYLFTEDWYYAYSMLCENRCVVCNTETEQLSQNKNLVRLPLWEGMGEVPLFLRISKTVMKDRRFDSALKSLQAYLKEELNRMYGKESVGC